VPIPSEDELERWVLEILTELGWTHVYGPDVAPDEPGAERRDYRDVVLAGRLAAAVARLNPHLPIDAVEDVVRTVQRAESPLIETENWNAYRFLIQGVPVEYRDADGVLRNDRAWLIDWEHPKSNDLAAINQFSIQGPKKTRRPDVLLFVNGLPLAIFELKRRGKAYARVDGAFRQLQTYRSQIPEVFKWNQVAAYVVSQLAGAFLASLLLRALFPSNPTLGATLPAGSEMQSFILEAVLTFFLMLVILFTSQGAREVGVLAGIAIGATVLLEAMFAGPICGASMNPARSIAPAVVSLNTHAIWVYILAPTFGAIMATFAWRIIR